jgi:hypothetical protein
MSEKTGQFIANAAVVNLSGQAMALAGSYAAVNGVNAVKPLTYGNVALVTGAVGALNIGIGLMARKSMPRFGLGVVGAGLSTVIGSVIWGITTMSNKEIAEKPLFPRAIDNPGQTPSGAVFAPTMSNPVQMAAQIAMSRR